MAKSHMLQRTVPAMFAAGILFSLPLAHAEKSLQKQANIAYGEAPQQVLDVYRPATPGPHRLVVFLHGGGWVKGSKNAGRTIAPALTAAGYVVASLEYRRVPETTPAGAVADAAQGIAYLLKNASQFGFEADRFAIIGHSSGAHMVALLGIDQHYLQAAGVDPRRIAAVITLDGVFDVDANLTNFPSDRRMAVFGTDPSKWRDVSPVDLLDKMKAHPRFCLVHEDRNDRFVEQEGLFEKALQQHGESLESATAPGLSHGELLNDFSDPTQPMAPFVLSCLSRTLPLR